MLTFINSKLPDKLVVLTNKTKFSEKVNPMKYPVQTYILVRTWNLLFMYFTDVSHKTMKIIVNVLKTSNLIKVISNHNICSGIKSQQAKKKTFVISSTKNFLFFSEFLCSISSSHFRAFNFMCAFNR